ncbi:hypothetical protein WJX84_003509 [Apatococcus fuscideae]|uniref:Uncharacterized protein n=1 Tax=Apatococcus fuscideae TaxID=2026836 RepID=A0AAW1T7A5_9CHLO
MGYSPLRLAWAPFSVARSVIVTVPSALSRSVTGLSTGLAPVDNNSLRSAIRNVTADPDQMSALIQEYFEEIKRVDPQQEQDFRDFLGRKAQRSYPKLEIWLDWLLFIYKMALPFLLFFTVIKLTGAAAVARERRRQQQQQQEGLRQ